MAAQPFKINDRRGNKHLYRGSSNQLYPAAVQTNKRRAMPRLDRDYHANVSDMGWRELLSAARYVCGRFGPVRGAIRQMATYAVGTAFNVQYYGANRAWGEQMEAAMEEWDKVCDVRGQNVDFRKGLILDLVSIIRDGDSLTLLTEGESGWPMVQSIPAHRIGTGRQMAFEELGGGFTVVNGVVLNSYGRAVGFRVFNDGVTDAYRELSAVDAALHYDLDYHEQARGVTWLAPVIEDVADLYDIRSFLKTALKAESSVALIEENESGAAPSMNAGGQFVLTDQTTNYTDPANSAATEDGAVTTERLEEGAYIYFRSNTGSRISAPNTNRPGQDSQKFYFEILRGSFEALGWPIEFYDPSALGGANIRMRVAQAKRTVDQLQSLAKKIATRKHRYAIAKMMKLGLLPFDVDWWKIDHQTPRDLTVDNGRDTKAEIEMYLKGAISLEELTGRNGDYWEDVQDQKIREEKRLQDRCKAEGVDPNRIQILTASGMAPGQGSAPAAPQDAKEKDEDE